MYPSDSKFLVVDDSSFSRTSVVSALKDMGFWKIMEADGAKSAVAIFQEAEQTKDPVHLVVLDLHMPEMTGLQLVKWVRTVDRIKDIPIIVITASQDRTDVLEAGKLGVTHFMIKPFDAQQLKDRLGTAWKKTGQKYYEANRKT